MKESSERDVQALVDALREHYVMALATSGLDGPHTTPVFYVLGEDRRSLLFMSKPTTLHCRHIAQNPRASGCIYSDTKDFRVMHGVKLTGSVTMADEDTPRSMLQCYYRAFPEARLLKLLAAGHKLFIFQIETARLIDNRPGFGTSYFWNFSEASPAAAHD